MSVEKNGVKLKKISHIAIAVRSIETALEFYKDILGLPVLGIEDVPEEGVRIALLALGESRLELISPTSPDTPVSKFIDKRGEGIHHLSIQTSSIAESIEKLKANSREFVGEAPRKGANKSKIAFIHPKGTHGVLLELCEEDSEKTN